MMKRKGLWLALLALLAMMISAPALADSYRFGTVEGSGRVNLRERNTTSSRKLAAYEGGTWMRIIGEAGGWYQVTAPDGRTGWMRSDLIYISASAKGTIGVVDVNKSLTLRQSPSTSARSLGEYPDGTPCILLSESGSWYHVTVDGKAGYFNSSYVDKKYMVYASELATVTSTGSVNLRKGPGTRYSSVKSLKDGTIVMVLQKGDDWWKVSAGGTVGFIDRDFLKDGVRLVKDDEPVTPGEPGTSYTGTATVHLSNRSSRLNLRKSASSNSASLGTFAHGTQVTVLTKASNWCRVRVNGIEGYMATAYLKFGGSGSSSGGGTSSGSETVICYAEIRMNSVTTRLNLRESASTSSRSLGTYAHGTMVSVLTKGSSWCKVRVDGKTGYMATRYLSFNGTQTGTEATVVHPDGTYVNLRANASLDSSVLLRVPHGRTVDILVYGKTWCYVQYKNYTGYMMTTYLER